MDMDPRKALALIKRYMPKNYGSNSGEQLVKKENESALATLEELIDIYESLEKNLTLNNLIKCSYPRGGGRSMTHAEEILKDILIKKEKETNEQRNN